MMIADTDVLIDFLRGANPGASRIAQELEAGGLRTTVVSRFELLAGARTAKEEGIVRDLLAAVTAIPLDGEAADRAAEVRRSLEIAGRPIGMGDSLIAGIVLAQDGVLITRNRGHFERVAGLHLTQMPGR